MGDHYVKIKGASEMTCMSDGCNQIIDSDFVQRICTPDTFARYNELMSNRIENIARPGEKVFFCKNTACIYKAGVIVESELNKLECPGCRKLYCVQCDDEWHQGVTCAQFQRVKKAKNPDELWKAINSKPCPKCKAPIQKIAGCNYMMCARQQ